jgi:hypothetical protein
VYEIEAINVRPLGLEELVYDFTPLRFKCLIDRFELPLTPPTFVLWHGSSSRLLVHILQDKRHSSDRTILLWRGLKRLYAQNRMSLYQAWGRG